MREARDAAHGRRAAVLHPVLSGAPRTLPIGAARLTDRQRIGVLLQGAALLSILERAGWRLARGWGDAGVAGGRLYVPAHAVSAGPMRGLAQGLLRELLLRLFGAASWAPAGGSSMAAGPSDAESTAGTADVAPPEVSETASGAAAVAGRGEARRAARALLREW